MEDREYTSIALPLIAILGFSILNSCHLSNIESKLDGVSPKIQMENVLRENAPEEFYVIDGDTSYVTIDGRPASEYFPR